MEDKEMKKKSEEYDLGVDADSIPPAEKEEPVQLTVTAARVREVAKSCPQWERGLKTLFPEAFPNPVRYFKCGTVFMIQKWDFRANPNPKMMACRGEDNDGGVLIPFDRLVILIHSKNASEYQLVHMCTGYNFAHQHKIYKRKLGLGIEIPLEDLLGLVVYSESNVTAKT